MRVIVEAETEKEKVIRLDAFTVVVSAHGGLLEMSLRVSKGQKLLLFNLSAGLREPCRVVRVAKCQDELFAVAFEFDSPTPQFWLIAFPPEGWVLVPP